jgi:hypothetical protein
MHEYIEGIAAGGRGFSFGASRGGKIAGGVRSRFALAVDEVELFVRIAGEDEVVMEQVVVSPLQTQIENNARTGGFIIATLLESLRGLRRGFREKFPVSANTVGIGNNRREVVNFARVGFHPAYACAVGFGEDTPNTGFGAIFHPEFFTKANQGVRNRPNATSRIPDPFARLHMRNTAENGGGILRA